MADEKLLGDLQDGMIRLLLNRVKDGTASASDLAVARALLRDNGITAVPAKGSPLGNLADYAGDGYDGDQYTPN